MISRSLSPLALAVVDLAEALVAQIREDLQDLIQDRIMQQGEEHREVADSEDSEDEGLTVGVVCLQEVATADVEDLLPLRQSHRYHKLVALGPLASVVRGTYRCACSRSSIICEPDGA